MIYTEQLMLTEPDQDDFDRYFNINAIRKIIYIIREPMKYELQ